MTAPLRPYDRATRMGDSDYPGALRPVGEGWRVAVSPDGRRYRLQPGGVPSRSREEKKPQLNRASSTWNLEIGLWMLDIQV